MTDNGTGRITEDSNSNGKTGFFRGLWRFFRNAFIVALILVPCGYAVKLQLKLKDTYYMTDSLKNALTESYARLDSLKLMQDSEALLKDSLDDMVDRKLDDGLSKAMIMIDTTMDFIAARKAVEDNITLDYWVDTLCARYPDGVASHVKLHYLKERNQRLERLNYRLSTKFPEHADDGE